MAKAGERIIMVTIIGETRKLNTSPIPSYQQEQRMKDWDDDLDRASSHHTASTPVLPGPTKKVLPHWMTTLPHV